MPRYLAFFLLIASSSAWPQQPNVSDFPFWQLNAGWWRSDNTYFDGDLNYNIRSYNSVIHIELDGRTLRETEYKSYAPSKLAMARGEGSIAEDEGIEAVTVTTWELVDEDGTLRITSTQPAMPGALGTITSILDDATGSRVTRDPDTGVYAYQMLITLPTDSKRYIANYGLVGETGDLRGFSLFRGTRISAREASAWRDNYRAMNNVAAVIEAGKNGAAVLRRLDEH